MKKNKDRNIKNDKDNAQEFEEDVISKSEIKRALQEILLFGEKLLALSSTKLAKLPISELLQAEILLAKRLKVDNSRRRQMQRIGKILRSENYEEVLKAYNELEEQNRQHQQSGNPAEKWSEKLMDNTEALSNFIQDFPDIDRQHFSQLIRNAKKERSKEGNSKKNQQRLFKFIQTKLLEGL